MYFLDMPRDVVLNNGDIMPMKPHYFLCSFDRWYGPFPQQQALTDLGNALYQLAYRGEVGALSEPIMNGSAALLEAMAVHASTVKDSQKESVAAYIAELRAQLDSLQITERAVHAR